MRGSILHRVTREYLKKNKVRTMVTIAGIILSAAMITAVTTSITSLQRYLFDSMVTAEGDWQFSADLVEGSKLSELSKDERVEDVSYLQSLGYAKIDSTNEQKPYLFVAAVSENYEEHCVLKLKSGKMPENSSEIILPNHLASNGGVFHEIGDTITVLLGDRMTDGEVLPQSAWYFDTESFSPREERTYTVVGFYERSDQEEYWAPGYMALTVPDGTGADSYKAFINMKDLDTAEEVMLENFVEFSYQTHTDVFYYSGTSKNSTFHRLMVGFGSILIAIIMFGSVSLIYNAFGISVNERTKQFGILKSIGATRRQIRHSVIYEGLCLCVIGIPLGIAAGLVGIGITLKMLGQTFASFMNTSSEITLSLHASWTGIAVSVIMSLITVIISAYIPAHRAVKLDAIESIRQSRDINIRAGEVKTSKLTEKLFHFEGMLAKKNYKRSRRKYRATIVSLFLSVVLFISTTSFCSYLTSAINAYKELRNYDICAELSLEEAHRTDIPELAKSFVEIADVEEVTYSQKQLCNLQAVGVEVSAECEKYARECSEEVRELWNRTTSHVSIYQSFLKEEEFKKLVEANGQSMDTYLDKANPNAIVVDNLRTFMDGKRYSFSILKNKVGSLDVLLVPEKIEDDYYYSGMENTENGILHRFNNDDGEELTRTEEELRLDHKVSYQLVLDKTPFGVEANNSGLLFIYPMSMMEAALEGEETGYVDIYINASNTDEVYREIEKILESRNISVSSLYNANAAQQSDAALLLVVTVFSYGFIALISMIAMANVFNTIYTNITLRKREFAMLRSVGMTKKGFHRMMNLECLLYGIKGLLYGIPVALLVSYGIYRMLSESLATSFYVPVTSIVISVGSVFLVVFATMLYAINRINKENTIDTLKNENF